jgi:hypothetical protein
MKFAEQEKIMIVRFGQQTCLTRTLERDGMSRKDSTERIFWGALVRLMWR